MELRRWYEPNSGEILLDGTLSHWIIWTMLEPRHTHQRARPAMVAIALRGADDPERDQSSGDGHYMSLHLFLFCLQISKVVVELD